MLTKSPERAGPLVQLAKPATQRRNEGGSVSMIGADLKITGNLECRGEVEVDGAVEGDIRAQRIVIGEGARITGHLIAEAIEVRGSVQGSIRGNAVILQSTSRVDADVFHKTLAIEQGAFFEGKSRRSDDPMSIAAPARSVLPSS